MRSFSHLNGNLVTLESKGLFNILIPFQNVCFFMNGVTSFAWGRAVCMKPHWDSCWIWSDVMPQCCLEKKKMSSWTKSSDGTPSLTGRVTALPSWTPHLAFLRPVPLPWQRLCGQQRSSALWPPGELTFGLRVIKRGQGVSSCWKTVKALHWLAIICPFHTLIYVIGILTNWPFVHC